MLTLPDAIVPILAPFATLFTNPTWRKAQLLMVGAILATGQRTVAAALRVMGRSDQDDYARYHEVLNRAVWSPREAARILLWLLLQYLDHGDGPLIFGIDETLERRRGARIRARGIYRDAVRSSRHQLVKASGLRWISLMWLDHVPWAGRYWALPFLTPLPVLSPYLRQIQFPVQQGSSPGASVGQKYPNLTVFNPPRRAAVLPLHSHRLAPLLEEAGLVHHQHPVGGAQMLDHVVPEVIANQVRIPAIGGQQGLHPVGCGIPRLLRQLPPVLALDRADQSPQVVQYPPARLRAPEPSGNAGMNLLNPFGPAGHFRQFLFTPRHRRTPSPDNGLFYPLICDCSTKKLNSGRGTVGKTAVAVAGAKDRNTGKVKVAVVERTDRPTLQGFVRYAVEPGTTVYTDEHAAYRGIATFGIDHAAVRHGVGEYVNGQAHTNGIENFWSNLKRGYHGVYHQMSPKHLHRYAVEFAGRHNVRPMDTVDQMTSLAVGSVGKHLPYEELIAD